MVKQRQSDLLKQVQKEQEPLPPKDPPADFEFLADPPSISAFDLDVVKLTAQFVARNGRQFLTNLMNKEQRNYQFDFLRPQHSLFQYFTKLLEQYTKVLIPPKDLLKKLGEESQEERLVKEQTDYRVRWIRHVEEKKRREEEEAELLCSD
jgi:splicing factor 3A subunit 1